MNIWQNEIIRIINVLLGRPQGIAESMILWVATITVLCLVTHAVGTVVGVPRHSGSRVNMALFLGMAIMLGVAAGISVLLDLRSTGADMKRYLMFGGAVTAALIVGIPIQSRLMKSRYIQTFVGFGSGIAAALLAIMAVHAVLDSVSAGEKESVRIRRRGKAIENFVGQ